MQRDCNQCGLDCTGVVQRYLDAGTDHASRQKARNRLLENIHPLIERVVQQAIWNKSFRELRHDAVQNTIVKLCDPAKVRTWFDNPRRARFCCWAAVVARYCAIDVLRSAKPTGTQPPDGNLPSVALNPVQLAEQKELSKKIRKAARGCLAEFPVAWQLVFFMRYSYLKPTIAEIMDAVGRKDSAIHDQHNAILQKVRAYVSSRELFQAASAPLVGGRHPLKNYELLDREQQKTANRDINSTLLGFTVKEQAVFYMKYSPLTEDDATMAKQFALPEKEVREILQRIKGKLRDLFGSEMG